MSDTPIEIVSVKEVFSHPNADRLDIVKVLNTQFVSQKGEFVPGALCVYFPPDLLIPEKVAERLGVKQYLKHAVIPGDLLKSQCRISAIRLRSIPSYGFGLALSKVNDFFPDESHAGDDVTDVFSGVKYQPPAMIAAGDRLRDLLVFHTYTNIQHYYRYAHALTERTPVRITEKIHGTNSRVGYIYTGDFAASDNGFEIVAGTHHRRCAKENVQGRMSLYWTPLQNINLEKMLLYISENYNDANVIIFGEIFGNKVQRMDYGVPHARGYRVCDISVDGRYLNWCHVKYYCLFFDIPIVPLLYEGPFSHNLIEKFVNGPTTLCEPNEIQCSFKGREGIVTTPLSETYSEILQGRLILKAVSSDYYQMIK